MTKTLIEKTQQIWHDRLNIEISQEEARQILDSAARFFSTIQEWDAKDRAGITIAADPKNIYRIETPRLKGKGLDGQQKGAA